ncbi:MAG: hypothetical protein KDK70_02805 [Myxococcales bacterium]|nr:hypothetical protein [Myxococcales bacterium]
MSLSVSLMAAAACAPLPEVQYETDRLQIAPDFDDPICEGTLAMLDEHLEEVELGLGEYGERVPFRLYWMREGIVEFCGEGRGGCFFPSTHLMFAQGHSITHEMTHAVLDSEGESYFLEEGMAELLSGVGVYYDLSEDPSGPAERLRLSRTEYRAGGFDYDAAAHFMRYIYDQRGVHGVRRLAMEVEGGASPARLEDTLEQVMGGDIDEVEAAYRRSSREVYEGLGYERTKALMVQEIDEDEQSAGPERLEFSVQAQLDCAAEDTMGPLPEEREGMYQVRRVRVPQNRGALLRVEGDPGTWVEVFDPYAKARRGAMVDWMFPLAALDSDAIRLVAGEQAQVQLAPGTWAIVLGADGAASGTVSLHVTLAAPAPPPDPTQTI